MFCVLCINLYLSRVILSTLGVVDYGIYNVIAGVVSMFSFLTGSVGGAASRYLSIEIGLKNADGVRRNFSSLLLIFIVFGFTIILLGETAGLWFVENKLIIPTERMEAAGWLYQLTIAGAFVSMLQVPYTAILIAYEKMSVYAYIGIFDVLLKLLFVYLLGVIDFDKLILWGTFLTFGSLNVLLIYFVYVRRKYPESRFKFSKKEGNYRELLTYSGWDLLGCLSVVAQGQGINMVLNIFFGPIVNAARGIAYQVESAINQFTNNFLTAGKTQIFKAYAVGDIAGMMKLVVFSTKMSFILMYMLTLPLLLELPYVLNLWLGHYPEYTVTFTSLVLINNLLVVLRTPRGIIYHAMNKIKYTSTLFGVLYCMALPVSYGLCKIGYPPYIVFFSIIFINVLSEVMGLVVMKHYIGYSIRKYFFEVDFRCFLLVLFSTYPLWYIHEILNNSFLYLLINVVLSVSIISFISYWICLSKNEKEKTVLLIKHGLLYIKKRV